MFRSSVRILSALLPGNNPRPSTTPSTLRTPLLAAEDIKHTIPAPLAQNQKESEADCVVDMEDIHNEDKILFDLMERQFKLMEEKKLPDIIPAVETQDKTLLTPMDEKDRELFDDTDNKLEHGNENYFENYKECKNSILGDHFTQPKRERDDWYLPPHYVRSLNAPTGEYAVLHPDEYSLSLAANLKKIEETGQSSQVTELLKTIGSVFVTAPMGLYMLKTDETHFKVVSFAAYMLLNTIINRRTLAVAPPIVQRYLTNIKNNFIHGKYLAALKDVAILLMGLGTSVAMGSISFETTATKLPQLLALLYSVLVGLTFGSTRTFGLDRLRQRLEKYFYPDLALHKQDVNELNLEYNDFKPRREYQLERAHEQLKLLEKDYRDYVTLQEKCKQAHSLIKNNQHQQTQTEAAVNEVKDKKGWTTLTKKYEAQLHTLKQNSEKLNQQLNQDQANLNDLKKTLKQPDFCGRGTEDKRFAKLSEHYQKTALQLARNLYAKDSPAIKHMDVIFDSKEDFRLQKVLDDTKNQQVVTLAKKIITEEDEKKLEAHKKELNQVLAAPSKNSPRIIQACLDLRARHLDREHLAQQLHNHCTATALKSGLTDTSARLLECKMALNSYVRLTQGLPELKENPFSSWSSYGLIVADCIFAGLMGCSATFPFAQRFFQGAQSIPGLNYLVSGPVECQDATSILFNLSTAVFYFVQNSALRLKVLDAFKTLRGADGELRKAKAAELIAALGFSGLSSLGVYNLFLGIAKTEGDQRIFNWLTENQNVFSIGAYSAAAGAAGLNLMFWLDARFQPQTTATTAESDAEWETVEDPVLVGAEKEEQPLKIAMPVVSGGGVATASSLTSTSFPSLTSSASSINTAHPTTQQPSALAHQRSSTGLSHYDLHRFCPGNRAPSDLKRTTSTASLATNSSTDSPVSPPSPTADDSPTSVIPRAPWLMAGSVPNAGLHIQIPNKADEIRKTLSPRSQ